MQRIDRHDRNSPMGHSGFYVWGQHTSCAWYLLREDAEREVRRMNYRGGCHYTVRPA